MATLLDELFRLYPDSSKRTLKKWIEIGRVQIDGSTVQSYSAPADGEITLLANPIRPAGPVPIIYCDPHICVVNKPSGLLSVSKDSGAGLNVLSYLRQRFPKGNIFAVHRLDRDASGVLVVARTLAAKEGLDDLFFRHDLHREYRAIVSGKLRGKGSWHDPLLELPSKKVVVDPKGKKATTHYESVEIRRKTTVLRVVLETGRKHQIRVHTSHAGYPICGDTVYGGPKHHRLCLHAYKLQLKHPVTQKQLTFIADFDN